MWRVFLALEIPEDLRARLLPVHEELLRMKRSGDVRLSVPRLENLHLTLRFLGDVRPEKTEEIQEVLTPALRDAAAFPLRVAEIGGFPDLRRPRVIWGGVEAEPALMDLFRRVEDGLEKAGFGREKKPFRPHLTLARVKSTPPGAFERALAAHREAEFGSFSAARLALFRSERLPEGARYTPIVTWNLGDS